MARPHRFRTLARLLPLLSIAFPVPHVATGRTLAPDPGGIATVERAEPARAAGDSVLAPWRRGFMTDLARTGTAAALDSTAAGDDADPAAASPDAAVDGAWTKLPEAAEAGARGYASLVHDPVRDRMILFGGLGADGLFLGDVWALGALDSPWALHAELSPAGTPPSARGYHTAIYDPVRDRVIVFGGYNASGHLGDLWALSLSGTPTWTQLAPEGTPPCVRGAHGAVYDPVRDRMVVFGGRTSANVWLNDVWALSLGDTMAWTQLAPEGEPPARRQAMTVTYDAGRDRLVVFGGFDGTAALDDVWALTLGEAPAWTELTPSGASPPARYYHGAIHDPVRDRLVLLGGATGAAYLDDVWALSLAGAPAWTELAPAGEFPPPPVYAHSAAYDAGRDRMIVFGGYWGSHPLDYVWGLSLGDASAWTLLTRTPPSPRDGHSAILDPARDRMIVFGGYGGAFVNDVWELPLSGTPAWTRLAPSGTPPCGRATHGAVYDPVRDRMVVFGGRTSSNVWLNDVWALSLGDAPAWTRLAPAGTPPAARQCHSAVYDPARERVIVFGGFDGAGARGDLWELSLGDAPAWRELTPAGTPPAARYYHSATCDPARDRMVVFGGATGGSYLNDVWTLSLGDAPAWTRLAPAGETPGGRCGQSAVYDPLRDRLVLFGGEDAVSLNSTWMLSLGATPAWTRPYHPAESLPPVRSRHGAVYDPTRDRMVVFGGGSYGLYTSYRDDTWLLTWGAPGLAGVACPDDVVWMPGLEIPFDYVITNPYAFAQTARYTLSSPRDWPGFPVTGSVTIGAAGTTTVPISISPPDTAAYGGVPLTFAVTTCGVLQHVRCSHSLLEIPVPVQLALVRTDVEPGLVRLTWHAAGGSGTAATVHRRTQATAWGAVGTVVSDGAGLLVYEDRAVAPGASYGYRLGVREAGGETFLGEAWVSVPAAAAFALPGARPNPSGDGLTVAFSLPDPASPGARTPARLEVFDLAGRRVAARDVGGLGGGSHVVRLDEGGTLGAGVYLVRLTCGDRALTGRAVVVR